MSSFCRRHSSIVRLALALACLSMLASSGAAQETARVELRAHSVSPQVVVTLGDVARISGGNATLQTQLAALDVGALTSDVAELELSKALIRARIQLAVGEPVMLDGPDTIEVTRRRPEPYDKIVVEKTSQALTEAWGVNTDAVRCRLMQPLEESLFASDASADDLEVVLPHNPRPGTMRVKLLIHEQGRLRDTVDISVSTQLFAEVVVAQTNLPRNHVLEEIDLISRWQAVSRPGETTPKNALVGKSLKMPVRAGQIVQARYVATASVAAEPVVRTRDTVRLVARKGALTITVTDAEVLQNGAIGDRVRVRNPKSKKIVSARVVSRNEVVVEM